ARGRGDGVPLFRVGREPYGMRAEAARDVRLQAFHRERAATDALGLEPHAAFARRAEIGCRLEPGDRPARVLERFGRGAALDGRCGARAADPKLGRELPAEPGPGHFELAQIRAQGKVERLADAPVDGDAVVPREEPHARELEDARSP